MFSSGCRAVNWIYLTSVSCFQLSDIWPGWQGWCQRRGVVFAGLDLEQTYNWQTGILMRIFSMGHCQFDGSLFYVFININKTRSLFTFIVVFYLIVQDDLYCQMNVSGHKKDSFWWFFLKPNHQTTNIYSALGFLVKYSTLAWIFLPLLESFIVGLLLTGEAEFVCICLTYIPLLLTVHLPLGLLLIPKPGCLPWEAEPWPGLEDQPSFFLWSL